MDTRPDNFSECVDAKNAIEYIFYQTVYGSTNQMTTNQNKPFAFSLNT